MSCLRALSEEGLQKAISCQLIFRKRSEVQIVDVEIPWLIARARNLIYWSFYPPLTWNPS